jgi:hypothetical protein
MGFAGVQGNVIRYAPGDVVSVEVLADSNGDAATQGLGVELVGETPEFTQVELVESANQAIGVLAEDPEGYDSSTSYSSGNVVGPADLILTRPVFLLETTSGYTATVGDEVSFADGGQIAKETGVTSSGQDGTVTNNLGVDGSGNLENASASDHDVLITGGIPFGVVFRTLADDFDQASKVAVAGYR